ncbi:peptide ABC transporter permease [Microbacterium sp. Root61]|uniref:ABC transporter permease n=1 Tax=Microbacterium sp. Root61 TaxID=1736570 RepID=UPI0006F493E3|nr:ABC transporter permease [Microbacterium sp. Root61]KRA24848.1 peptide ABC transporter permease [Microbacterium sp. Root61]
MTVTDRIALAGQTPAVEAMRARLLIARYTRALRTPRGLAGSIILGILIITAVAAPLLFPGGYDVQSRDALALPTLAAPFGTDEVGRNIFVRAVFGTRTDLSLVGVAIPIAAVLGTLLGLIGIINRTAGNLAQRLFDLIMGFPSLILGICVTLVIGPGWLALVLAMTIYALPAFGRLSRATLLSQEHRDYVSAARMLGVTKSRIMARHILPHTLDTMIAQMVVAAVAAIFLESSLSIVGLGVQPPEPSLGVLLNSGARYMEDQPFYVLGPAAVLFLLVLGFSLLADAVTSKDLPA